MGDALAENVAWSYEHPHDTVAAISNLIAFYRHELDTLQEHD